MPPYTDQAYTQLRDFKQYQINIGKKRAAEWYAVYAEYPKIKEKVQKDYDSAVQYMQDNKEWRGETLEECRTKMAAKKAFDTECARTSMEQYKHWLDTEDYSRCRKDSAEWSYQQYKKQYEALSSGAKDREYYDWFEYKYTQDLDWMDKSAGKKTKANIDHFFAITAKKYQEYKAVIEQYKLAKAASPDVIKRLNEYHTFIPTTKPWTADKRLDCSDKYDYKVQAMETVLENYKHASEFHHVLYQLFGMVDLSRHRQKLTPECLTEYAKLDLGLAGPEAKALIQKYDPLHALMNPLSYQCDTWDRQYSGDLALHEYPIGYQVGVLGHTTPKSEQYYIKCISAILYNYTYSAQHIRPTTTLTEITALIENQLKSVLHNGMHEIQGHVLSSVQPILQNIQQWRVHPDNIYKVLEQDVEKHFDKDVDKTQDIALRCKYNSGYPEKPDQHKMKTLFEHAAAHSTKLACDQVFNMPIKDFHQNSLHLGNHSSPQYIENKALNNIWSTLEQNIRYKSFYQNVPSELYKPNSGGMHYFSVYNNSYASKVMIHTFIALCDKHLDMSVAKNVSDLQLFLTTYGSNKSLDAYTRSHTQEVINLIQSAYLKSVYDKLPEAVKQEGRTTGNYPVEQAQEILRNFEAIFHAKPTLEVLAGPKSPIDDIFDTRPFVAWVKEAGAATFAGFLMGAAHGVAACPTASKLAYAQCVAHAGVEGAKETMTDGMGANALLKDRAGEAIADQQMTLTQKLIKGAKAGFEEGLLMGSIQCTPTYVNPPVALACVGASVAKGAVQGVIEVGIKAAIEHVLPPRAPAPNINFGSPPPMMDFHTPIDHITIQPPDLSVMGGKAIGHIGFDFF